MALTDEQAKTIKEQLISQIESFPEDKRDFAKTYILNLNNEQLEEFLIKNKLIKTQEQTPLAPPAGSARSLKPQKPLKIKKDCIFCLLSNKLVPSLGIYEDKNYLACLEINPLNRGHTLLIPKKHTLKTKSLKQTAFSLADKIGKHLIKQLDAQNFQISSSDELKHAVINIIPVYKNQDLKNLKKVPAKKEELQKLAEKIGKIEKPEKKKSKKAKVKAPKLETENIREALIRLPRRIP